MKQTFLACVLLMGCADDRGGASDLIVAAEGGTVESDAATIVIAPNALAEDTAIELAVGDAADYPSMTGEYQVLVIEPAGTVLETPAEVTIDASFIGAADGEVVTISRIVDGGWSRVEHTEHSGGSVTTLVSELGPLAVGVAPVASGGSIEGTIVWGDGTPVGAAPIQLLLGDSLVTSTTSDDAGVFAFADLDPGSYRILVEYECTLMQDVSVAPGAPTEVALTLCAF